MIAEPKSYQTATAAPMFLSSYQFCSVTIGWLNIISDLEPVQENIMENEYITVLTDKLHFQAYYNRRNINSACKRELV